MSYKKKYDISPVTILSSIDKDIKELLVDVPKGLKPKLFSLQDMIKMLTKKLSSEEFLSKQNSSLLSKNESQSQIDRTQKIENELSELKEQNEKLKNEIKRLSQNLTDSQNKITKNLNANMQFKFILEEERNEKKMLLLQVKTVEDKFKTLFEEHKALELKHQELLNELSIMSNLNSDMKRNTNENKFKYDELIQMNCELRNKLSSYKSTMDTHVKELQAQMRKNAMLSSKIDKITKKNKELSADVTLKDEKINVLRAMNIKLEKNSNNIIKKWDTLSKIEARSSQMNNEANEKALDSLRQLTLQLNDQNQINNQLKESIQILSFEKENLLKDINNAREEIKLLRFSNKEISDKCRQYEETFKNKIAEAVKETNSRNNLVMSTGSMLSDVNLSKETVPIEMIQPAKLQD